jgi:nucleotide-binding universal stress UspA family protein
VTERDPGLLVRRILVALDASLSSLSALDAAVELAAQLEAELLGIFVEDVRLLRLAEAPYAREIRYPSASEAPLDRARMESKLKAQSRRAEKALAEAARRARVRWTFRSVRGHVAEELRAAAAEVDLVAMGRIGWSFGPRLRIGSAALELLAGTLPVLLLPEHAAPAKARFLVCYDGSLAARRALRIAAELAAAGTRELTVLVAAADPETARPIQKDAAHLLKGSGVEVVYRRIDPGAQGLVRALKVEKSGYLVLAGRELLDKLQPLESFLLQIEMPLLVLAGEALTEEPQQKGKEAQPPEASR